MLAVLPCLFAGAVYATDPFNVDKSVLCADVKTVIETITGGDYSEQPFWIGRDESSKFVLLVNERSKTWSMVQFNNRIACIIATGDSAKLINTGKAKIKL